MKHQPGAEAEASDDDVCIQRNVSSEINTPKVIKTKHKTTATATTTKTTTTPQWVPRLAGDIIVVVVVVVATRLVLNASLPVLALPLTPWSNNFHFAANGRKERIKFYEPQATERQELERLPEWQQRLPRQKFLCVPLFVLAIKSPVPFKPPPSPASGYTYTYSTPERMQLIWEVGWLCWERLNGVGASLGDLPAEQQIKRVRANFGQFKRLRSGSCGSLGSSLESSAMFR